MAGEEGRSRVECRWLRKSSLLMICAAVLQNAPYLKSILLHHNQRRCISDGIPWVISLLFLFCNLCCAKRMEFCADTNTTGGPAPEWKLMLEKVLSLCYKSIPMAKAKQTKGFCEAITCENSGWHFHNMAGFQQLLHILSHIAEIKAINQHSIYRLQAGLPVNWGCANGLGLGLSSYCGNKWPCILFLTAKLHIVTTQ